MCYFNCFISACFRKQIIRPNHQALVPFWRSGANLLAIAHNCLRGTWPTLWSRIRSQHQGFYNSRLQRPMVTETIVLYTLYRYMLYEFIWTILNHYEPIFVTVSADMYLVPNILWHPFNIFHPFCLTYASHTSSLKLPRAQPRGRRRAAQTVYRLSSAPKLWKLFVSECFSFFLLEMLWDVDNKTWYVLKCIRCVEWCWWLQISGCLTLFTYSFSRPISNLSTTPEFLLQTKHLWFASGRKSGDLPGLVRAMLSLEVCRAVGEW